MQGVFGGEKARQTLTNIDRALNQQQQVMAATSRLPKITENRVSTFNKRSHSIQPRNAATAQNTLHSNSNQLVLQSLVNNNAFLGRGKFQSNQRGSSIPSTTKNNPANQPVSPPSIEVKGQSSTIQQMIYSKRGSKVQVRLPGSQRRNGGFPSGAHYPEVANSIYGMPTYVPDDGSRPRL